MPSHHPRHATAQVPFVFHDTFELVGGERNLSDQLATYWTNMASSADPNTWAGPTARAALRPLAARGSAGAGWNHTNATRPANATHWWLLDHMDCDAAAGARPGRPARGESVGACPKLTDAASIAACEAACLANKVGTTPCRPRSWANFSLS
jgi:hypothetical protein